MPTHDWRSFLSQFSKELLADPQFRAASPIEAIASGWLGFPGASEAQLADAEARLGTRLPPSYRQFLGTTNGWLTLGHFINNIWPIEKVDWFRVRNQWAIDAWQLGENYYSSAPTTRPSVPDEKYFIYGADQDPAYLRSEYLHTALEISDWGDSAILLLNPQVVFDDGEWEAWFHANWLPGARRYRSFLALMQDEYQAYLYVRDHG